MANSSANKTQPTDLSPAAFLDAIDDVQRRKDAKAVLTMMKKATGEPAKMWGTAIVGFGSYHYKYDSGREGESMIVGFSPRKAALVLYLMGGLKANAKLLKSLGTHKVGGGCLYLPSLDDVDKTVLTRMIQVTVQVNRKVTKRG